MKKTPFYEENLSFVHHQGFGGFARTAGPQVLKILKSRGIRSGTLIDLGCGGGLWARAAEKAGFSVIGVDCSQAMIRLAKKTSPRSTFHCESLHTFSMPSSDAITIMGEGLNYLSNKRARPNLRLFFGRAARALKPSGMLIFDVICNEGNLVSNRIWREGKDWVVLVDFAEDAARRLLTRTIITFRKVNNQWRRRKEIHRVALYSRKEVESGLSESGFNVEVSDHYLAFPLPPRRLAFIAQKK